MNRNEIRKLSLPEQVEALRLGGLSSAEIDDYIAWFKSTPSQQGPSVSKPDQMADILERCRILELKARENPVREKAEESNRFANHVLHNRHLMGGPTIHDSASYHMPGRTQTDSMNWLLHEFHASACRMAVLFGGTGSGKTFAAMAYVNEIADVRVEMGRVQETDALYIHAYKLAESIHKFNRKPGSEDLDLSLVAKRRVLLLDDLGAEPQGYRGADFMAHLEYLINERYKFRRKTIITCNTTPEKFKELYGERIVSRFNEIGLFKESTQDDLRQQKEKR